MMPTILQTVGIGVPKEMQGESLIPMLQTTPLRHGDAGPAQIGQSPTSGQLHDRPAYAESDYPHRTFGWSSLRSLRTGKYLFIEAPNKELYDQLADPKAEHNLSANSVAVANTLDSQLETLRQKTTS